MTGFVGSIDDLTVNNTNFRQVIFTGKYTQLVLMALMPGEEIGNEIHNNVDQFFRIEQGQARFVINNGAEEHVVGDGDAVIIPAGTWHNIICISEDESLKMYTLYSPPNHPDGTIHATKADADRAEAEEHH